MQFGEERITINEESEYVDVPIVRLGGLAVESAVRCHTVSRTAIGGEDYVERHDSAESTVMFRPGEDVRIFDCLPVV